MTTSARMARLLVLATAYALAGCDDGTVDPAQPGKTTPPMIPDQGQFVWTAGGVTVTAYESFMPHGLKAVGYRFSAASLVIDAATEQLQFCSLITAATALPAPGAYPVGAASAGTFAVACADPTIAFGGSYVTEGEVVLTKAEMGDLEGTFTISGPTQTAAGAFNVGCIYADCVGPVRPPP